MANVSYSLVLNSATPPNNKKGPCVNNQLGDSIIQGDFSGGKTDISSQAMFHCV